MRESLARLGTPAPASISQRRLQISPQTPVMRCTATRTGALTHNVSVRMTKELYEQISSRPDVNWSLVARTAFKAFLKGEFILVTTPEGPALQPAPREAEPKTEKRKK